MTNTALIVLDYINGITEREELKNYMTKHDTMNKTNELIKYARKEKFLVIFVKVGFSDSYVELAQHSQLFKDNKSKQWLKLSEKSTDFDPRLDYNAGDITVIKHRVNAFYSTSLEAILQANKVKKLILCGVSTNMAVEGTARDAHDRDYDMTIASDACATYSEELQEKSLSILRMITQVKTVNEICQ